VGAAKDEEKVVDKVKMMKEITTRTTIHAIEDAVVEETADQIGTMLIVIIMTNMVIMQVKCYSEKKVEENANFVAKEEVENNDVVLLTNKENSPEKENIWYLDTGASNHMCGYKYMFTELKEVANGHVSFGDTSKVRVEGEGNILIKLKDETQKFISSVYYVPEMKSNILSLG
jgi:hypothetical protein